MRGLGNVKMRGKKFRVLRCGCCVAEDFRDSERWREASNDIDFSTQNELEPEEYTWFQQKSN